MRVNLEPVRPRYAVCGWWIYDTALVKDDQGRTIHLGCQSLPETPPVRMPLPPPPG